MKKKSGSKPKRNTARSVLRLPDLEHAKTGDRAAELNLGSIHKIPAEIRSRVNVEFQRWILDHITAHEGLPYRNHSAKPDHLRARAAGPPTWFLDHNGTM